MVLNRIFPNFDDPIVRLERFKLMAQGCQVLAIGLLAASIIGPIFNQGIRLGTPLRCEGGLAASVFEILGLRLMGYIALPATKGGRT